MKEWKKPRHFDYNLLVIGGGSAGLVSALVAATVKSKVALVEKHQMGGDCLNTGCVPSKALINCAKKVQQARTIDEFGLQVPEGAVDFQLVMSKVKAAIEQISPNDSVERFQSLGVNCIVGEARLLDPWTVQVGDNKYTSRSIVIATGARPIIPPIPGVETIDVLTSDTVWSLKTLPRRLLILGAGPIGCEMAQSFQRLGSQVIVVDLAERILPNEDADISELISRQLSEEGVRFLTGSKAIAFDGSAGAKRMVVEQDGQRQSVGFDEIFVAVGRRAYTESLNLESLGIATNNDGTVQVDSYQRTIIKHIYAAGDVAGPYQFTHMASHQAWYGSVNALFGMFRRFEVNYDVVPWCTFTDPEVARVGLNEETAVRLGISVEVSRYDMQHVDRAITEGNVRGFVKVLTQPGKDKVLGAMIVGPHAGELITEFVLAMTHGLGLKKILNTIHIYPTYSEINKFVAGEWRKAHAPSKIMTLLPILHSLFR